MQLRSATISELAELLQCETVGPDVVINSLGYVTSSTIYKRVLSFCNSENYFACALRNEFVGAVIVSEDVLRDTACENAISCIIAQDPRAEFYRLHNLLAAETEFYSEPVYKPKVGGGSRIHPTAIVESNVTIGNNVSVEPHCVIHKGTILEDDVRIGACSVIGAPGFEAQRYAGRYQHIEHVGGVILRQGVVVGSNSVIARSVFEGNTEIGVGTQVDSMVHISHNVAIGENCLICSGANLAGSCIVGHDCFLGVGCTISNGIRVENGSRINIAAVVVERTRQGQTVSGFYAMDNEDWICKTILERRSLIKERRAR